METTILQVPIKKTLRERATKAATRAGFSSLQEMVRVILAQLSETKLKLTFEHPPVKLSPKAARRYDRMSREIESGKVKPFVARSVKELMDHLTRP